MSRSNPKSIVDGSERHDGARVFLAVLVCAIAGGALAAWHVAQEGLTLSHFDARAHLVVARRVVDSLTPGWRQFGSLWLPLPHLLNVIPVQWDAAYRTGFTAVAISVGALSWGLAAVAERTFVRTGSWVLAVLPVVLIAADPNVLYLASTPMTEPLLIGAALLTLAALDAWIETPTPRRRSQAGWFLAALMMTRYEGWLIGAAFVGVAAIANPTRSLLDVARLTRPAALAVAAFVALGYASTGQWFLSSNFYVPEPEAFHQPMKVLRLMADGLQLLAHPVILCCGAAGLLVSIAHGRKAAAALLPVCLLATGVLPLSAFYAGHPFRIRYIVLLAVANLLLASVAVVAAPRRYRTTAAVALVGLAVWARPPLSSAPPVLVEARADTSLRQARARVSDSLAQAYDGTPILASMASLAHYMHESSTIGLSLRNFLHEGNGDLWTEALRSPRDSVHWILIEEQAEGGDVLAHHARADEHFLSGFQRVIEGGGLALYRRE